MAERKPHILLSGFVQNEDFQSRRTGRGAQVPLQNRASHGQELTQQYAAIQSGYDSQREVAPEPITEDIGIYVEIIGIPDYPLALDSLDGRDFKLRSCRKVDDRDVAVVFVPESRRNVFQKKLDQYLDPQKDSKGGEPRNHKLIDSISEVRLADLHSFWTDDVSLFPEDEQQVVWWELWLKRRPEDEDSIGIAHQLAQRIEARLGNTSLSFFDSVVVLIRASANQLKSAPELISNLQELRRAKETPTVLVESSPKEQQEWVADLNERVQIDEKVSTAVTILDAGVNYNHPLLKLVCSDDQAACWEPDWPHFDTYGALEFNDHGSRLAGLAVFGDLHLAVVSKETIELNHCIESARILPPTGNNEPELYGDITVGTASKLEIGAPDINRIFSLSVTAEPDSLGGLPSSWSSELDQFSSGFEDGKQRLFVISAGNNRSIAAALDYWEQVQLAEIEDPAQSWNALTIGAYTELTTNDDPSFAEWSPLAVAGDIAPASRSSVNWDWRKFAPFKPELVAEGGNRLLSPDKTEVTDADTVSLLTTSGRSSVQLFEVSADTSAACAQVSGHAAILMAEYPEFWPESIRALLVHSAEWTPRMWERFGLLNKSHSPKVAKESMLRTFGFGVPNLERARYSANHMLTLIAQGELQPFVKESSASASADPKLNEMRLHELPWPIEALQQLPPELEVQFRVTLSYFVEPNPGRRGYRSRYTYPSHGLRFDVIRPGQSLENFRASINKVANETMEGYTGPEGDNDGWRLGPTLRSRGSLHSDTWIGSAADLADMHTIAVYPVGGWWKYRTALDRWKNEVRYSLVVSIDTPDESIDIYTTVETLVEASVAVTV
ncbi:MULTISPECIES: S8 family peptidase [unclassified Microbulbifer]|uniref:S8 family peptidase n=1 Tax=unclassified Microbulbifer TaxID=2619833 RepID=UPI0027E3BF42|nr:MULTISPECIES: S8 family peptidase [unclassified Microbulbifer]